MTRFVSKISLTALVALAACATGRPGASHGSAVGVMGPEAAIARARADSARLPYTKADIDFMSGMISHHAQAIKMAKWATSHGANPSLIRLSERIVTGQT